MHFKTFDQYINSQYEGRSMIVLLCVSKRLVLLPEIVEKAITERRQNVHLTSLPYVFSGIQHIYVFYIAKRRRVFLHSFS